MRGSRWILPAVNPVGDSTESGFRRPNPVSIRREYPRSRLRVEWRMQKLQKMKILGAKCSGTSRCRIRFNPKIIPERISTGGGMDGVSHILTAIRTCSRRLRSGATRGSIRIGRIPTTSGIATTASSSPSRKSLHFSLAS